MKQCCCASRDDTFAIAKGPVKAHQWAGDDKGRLGPNILRIYFQIIFEFTWYASFAFT